MGDCAEFLRKKAIVDKPTGLTDIPELNPMLFDIQQDRTNFHYRDFRFWRK